MKIRLATLSFICVLTLLLAQFVANAENRYNAPLLLIESKKMIDKPFDILLQYLAPQRALTNLAGWLAESQRPWLKNYLISYFLKRHTVDMNSAVIEDPYAYPSFNSFFTRKLKPEARPIATTPFIASPADGYVSQIGNIEQTSLLQAKGFSYDLTGLLGGSEKLSALFTNGNFATFYLSPKDYHRVHMPVTGKLRETIFVPGRLFSVNQQTAANVPHLFARNERLICLFDTEIGPMAVILVGAMLVGSIETIWHADTSASTITHQTFKMPLEIAAGAELGHFKMGSTVIVLFAKDTVEWTGSLQENVAVKMGQPIGKRIKSE